MSTLLSDMFRPDVSILEINTKEGTPVLSRQCIELMYELIRYEQYFIGETVNRKEGYFRSLAQRLFQNAGRGKVATLGDEAIGLLLTDPDNPRHISALFVDPLYRKTGVGTEMILRLKHEYQGEALTVNVYNLNLKALSLYEGLGFIFEPLSGYVQIQRGTLSPH